MAGSAANLPRTPVRATRIVGLGASAGGLAALEEFLRQVPPKSGLAYVVVQHLDPTQKTMLTELLQRATTIPVHEAQSKMHVAPNCVYVIPPNAELSVADDRLNLGIPREPRGMRLPVNVLFSSLASTLGERAIAVVLSGMGSDGTLGLQAIKAVGGLTVVQAPDTAQFDSMPKSAIAAGAADIVAPPAQLPALILAYLAQMGDLGRSADDDSELAAAAQPLYGVFELLQRRTRHDFSLYKASTVRRRIERRMAVHTIATTERYVAFLRRNPQEIDLLFNELLIGVTSFFRDSPAWEHLANVALPELLARRTTERKLRAWVIGCSTGEEAYSLAMVFIEAAQQLLQPDGFTLQIFATDLSPDALATARRGEYPASIRSDVSANRRERFFSPRGNHYQINTTIRDMVLFAQHDVMLDPPFTKLDLIACRNLLIYFDPALQRRLIPLFHYSLRPGGVLMLGSAETVGTFDHLFTPIESKLRLYLRQDVSSRGPYFPAGSLPPLSKKFKEPHVSPPSVPTQLADSLQTAADKVLLQVHSPAAVVVNGEGDIVYISGRTGKYLEPAAGKANWNFHAMVRENLRAPIGDALKKAASQREALQLRGLEAHAPGGVQIVDVTVQALREPAALQGMTMVVFQDVAPLPTGRRRGKAQTLVEASHTEAVQRLRDEIQALREESRVSEEKLQAANEQLQSTNEELQSTNEELTTSKEEMQSMNEELQTINHELQTKLDDLALAQSDMNNLLNSTEIAILFLDQQLNVRRYTDRASKLINVRESDVGRPLSDLTTNLRYPMLHDDAQETLRTLAFSEKQIPAGDGRWFSVRIMPYRTLDNVIDGIVITFVDITATKKLESTLGANPPR
jgi:two-component system, chemotaxis family, CheB/CheR fusion protein